MSETITQTKICNKCKVEKELSFFSNNKTSKDGLSYYCRQCNSERDKKSRADNKDAIREYRQKKYQDNKEIILQQRKEYYEKNRENVLERVGKYTDENRESINKKRREFRTNNLEHMQNQDKKKYIKFREQILEDRKKYFQENKETINNSKKQWYQKNREYLLKQKKEYSMLNKDKIKKYQKEWRKTPIAKACSKNSEHKRRAIEKKGDITSKQLLELQQKSKNCYWCNTSLKGKKIQIDHYTPLSKGGEHTLSNLVVSCDKCNLTKNAKDPIIFANSIGKLL